MSMLPLTELAEEFVLPDYTGRSLVNISASILKHFGAEPPHPPLPDDVLPEGMLRGVKRVILLLIDALGYKQLLPLLDDRELVLNRLAKEGRLSRLTSVFPATTTTALASLATGLTPQEHGLLGYRLFLKEFGLVANMIRLSPEGFKQFDLLLQIGLKPERFFPAATIYQQLEPHGVRCYTLLRAAYLGTGLSHFLYRGSEALPFVSSSDLFVRLRRLLEGEQKQGQEQGQEQERGREGPLLINVYWSAVDAIGHLYGPSGAELRAEVRQLAYSLEQEFLKKLSPGARQGTLLLITADHGQVGVTSEDAFRVTRHPRFHRSLLVPPTGDFRAAYLHLRQGELEAIERYLRRFRDRFIALRSEEALAGGLFGKGKPLPGIETRLGDLILLCRGQTFIFYPYDDKLLKGYHGSLSAPEMHIPLLAVRLD